MSSLPIGQLQRVTAVSNTKTAIVTAKAGRVINPHEVNIINTDTVGHVVDFFDGTAGGATLIFTVFVPSDGVTGGEADWYEDTDISSWTQKMTAGNSLGAASRDAVGGAGLEFTTRFGRV